MTGGVEYEAMGYLVSWSTRVAFAQARAENSKLIHSQTSHFRLINALGTRAAELRLPAEEEHSAYKFHKDMFLSGVERIIIVSALPVRLPYCASCYPYSSLTNYYHRLLAKHQRPTTQRSILSFPVTLHLPRRRDMSSHGRFSGSSAFRPPMSCASRHLWRQRCYRLLEVAAAGAQVLVAIAIALLYGARRLGDRLF
jgi:hypothetical protein